MNILVPDSWLRKYLETDATPEELQRYVSLSGPSIERIYTDSGEPVYDIEITGNRPDSMSIIGVAREAAAILPRFGKKARFLIDPYAVDPERVKELSRERPLKIAMHTDERLNPRSMLMVIDGVTVGPSPAWMSELLTKTGIRSLNTLIDVTNAIMRIYGQPAHVFDYDEIKPDASGIPTMIVRESKKGETLKTLDGKNHTLSGGDIVIEDGSGRLIDLCGIMGGYNSRVTEKTTRAVLFLQTYDPVHIRRSSMALSHHTDAGSLFEKGTDTDLVEPAMIAAIDMMKEIAGGREASRLHDVYPTPFAPYQVSVTKEKLIHYIGETIPDTTITTILTDLGFAPSVSVNDVSVTVPSFRRDVTIDVDIIEEIARIHGYNAIPMKLPTGEIPKVLPDPILAIETDMKIRLRDWGYTELFTYSTLSRAQMEQFSLDTRTAYMIQNPLTEDWVYMAPSKWPAILSSIADNLRVRSDLRVFEISNRYVYREGDLPHEQPILSIAATGETFRELKGIAEMIFTHYGIEGSWSTTDSIPSYAKPGTYVTYGGFGSVYAISDPIRTSLGITKPVMALEIRLDLIANAPHHPRGYMGIPKYPPTYEDFAIIFPEMVAVGPIIDAIKHVDPLIEHVSILDRYKKTVTFHVSYRSPEKSLTTEDTLPVRTKILAMIEKSFGGTLKQ